MTIRIYRSIKEDIREGLTWEERWKGDDKGLIACWETGRKLREKNPELARRAENNELPLMGWKGGIEREIKTKRKIGTHYYLAQWQGIRGEDLEIDPSSEPEITCTRTGITVKYTGDYEKYKNA